MPRSVEGVLFHRPATPVRGARILPLSQLRDRYVDLHDLHSSNYVRSPEVLTHPIAPLNCIWADVVFLSPVHPAALFAALRRSGRSVTDTEPWVLPASRLDPSRAIIRLMRAGTDGHHADPPDADDYLPLTTATLRAVNRITVDAVQRLESLGPEDPWLPWVDVPHVLYRGSIPLDWFTRTPD
ncbi:hypothetical protein MWU75_06305 [Ornithinimicrobium sp. F0845]|uniref:hypothetical protein n=1 Tax=Ornithinimicrobium sp. F0845 TaxID=2926412 RepID=UPI001FF689FD|nr:hypothetical protein [Ornithinimicrobium sp. F0845]MCK0111746.1 hypothetical protein [Ornithinimicrobium sp. F0845]